MFEVGELVTGSEKLRTQHCSCSLCQSLLAGEPAQITEIRNEHIYLNHDDRYYHYYSLQKFHTNKTSNPDWTL